MIADGGIAAQNRCIRINNHMIADVRMALDALNGIAVFIQLKALRAERYALIELDMIADHRRFADDDAGSVV